MRQILVTLIFLFGFSFISHSQDVEQVQKTLVTKLTATWCPNCGGNAWGQFHDMIDENQDKAIFFAAHASGSSLLNSTVADNLVSQFESPFGQPIFYTNKDKVSSGGVVSKVKTIVDANFDSVPLANTGLELTLDDCCLTVKHKVEFFEDGKGIYHLGLYLVEDHVSEYQASQGDNADHRYVLRSSVTGPTFGDQISIGDVIAGTTFEGEFTMFYNFDWDPQNLSVVAIIWEKAGNDYELVNIMSEDQISFVSDQKDLSNDGIQISWNNESERIQIQADNPMNQLEYKVYRIDGKAVLSESNIAISKGLNYINANLIPGSYVIQVQNERKQWTEKFIVQ